MDGPLVEFAILNFIDTLIRRIKKRDKERRAIAMELNQAQNSFYINPDNGFKVPPAQRTLKRADSVVDNDAMLEVRMTMKNGHFLIGAKSQLISKCPFGVKTSSQKPTKFFPGFLT